MTSILIIKQVTIEFLMVFTKRASFKNFKWISVFYFWEVTIETETLGMLKSKYLHNHLWHL